MGPTSVPAAAGYAVHSPELACSGYLAEVAPEGEHLPPITTPTTAPQDAGPPSACKHPAAAALLVIADTGLQAVPDTRHRNIQLLAPVLPSAAAFLSQATWETGKFYLLYVLLHPRRNKGTGAA